MDQKFFLVTAIVIGVIFLGLLIYSFVSAIKTRDRNNAVERTRAAIFSSQMEQRRKELEAEQKLEDNKEKLGVADYVKRPTYGMNIEPPKEEQKVPDVPEATTIPVPNRKLGDFISNKQ